MGWRGPGSDEEVVPNRPAWIFTSSLAGINLSKSRQVYQGQAGAYNISRAAAANICSLPTLTHPWPVQIPAQILSQNATSTNLPALWRMGALWACTQGCQLFTLVAPAHAPSLVTAVLVTWALRLMQHIDSTCKVGVHFVSHDRYRRTVPYIQTLRQHSLEAAHQSFRQRSYLEMPEF